MVSKSIPTGINLTYFLLVKIKAALCRLFAPVEPLIYLDELIIQHKLPVIGFVKSIFLIGRYVNCFMKVAASLSVGFK